MKALLRCLVMMLVFQTGVAQEVDDGDMLLNRPAERNYDIIIESGYLKVGLYQNFPPYSYLVNSEPQGIDVELGKRIAAAMGVESV